MHHSDLNNLKWYSILNTLLLLQFYMKDIRIVSPGSQGKITNEFGVQESPPANWGFLPAGDAAVTRKITAQGKYWRVQVKKGKRIQSTGIWAPTSHIIIAKEAVEKMRSAPGYEKKKQNAKALREKKQVAYAIEFEKAVSQFLNFHKNHKDLEVVMAKAVTAHAIPVGSGTVARTTMIPLPERASKAVIAWMRHQTTNYDHMKIARVKGERRAVRRKLASISVSLLKNYREGTPIDLNCPLRKVLIPKGY